MILRPLAALAVLAACGAGCGPVQKVDPAYLLEEGSIASLPNADLAALVRTLGARSGDEAQRTLAALLHGQTLDPALDGRTRPLCEAAVVRFRGETFVIAALTPWGTAVAGSAWIHLILFEGSGKVLDHVHGELDSRQGRIEIAMVGAEERRLACLIVAQSGATVRLTHRGRRQSLRARADGDNPVDRASGVVCQVGISDRKLKLLLPD
jgi:hypothetical protein